MVGEKCSHLSVSFPLSLVFSFTSLVVDVCGLGDMLSQEELPEKLLPKCLDVLRELSASERDLIRVCVEIVHELRDPKEEDEEEDPNVSSCSAFFAYAQKCLIVFDHYRKTSTPRPALGIPQQLRDLPTCLFSKTKNPRRSCRLRKGRVRTGSTSGAYCCVLECSSV